MADENEVLDWDEDDAQAPFVAAEHDDDAVSLGTSDGEPDELDEPDTAPIPDDDPPPQLAEKPSVAERTPSKRHSSPPRHEQSSSRRSDRDRDRHRDSRDDRDRDRDRDRDSHRERKSHKLTVTQPITHALPPKPVTTVPVFMHPNHPSSIEATLMAPSTLKDAKDPVSPFIHKKAPFPSFFAHFPCVASITSFFVSSVTTSL